MRFVRSSRSRVAAVGAASALLLAGCGSTANTASSPSASASATTGTGTATSTAKPGALSKTGKVSVTGGDAKTAPTVALPKHPYTASKTATTVIKPGTGAALTAKDVASVDLVLINGKDGSVVQSSYGQQTASFNLGDPQLIAGIKTGLIGQKVGSQVAIEMPPADAFGATGNPEMGIGANDTILLVVDVRSATQPLTEATGTAVAPKAGLPTVTFNKNAPAKITAPKTNPPTALVVQPLIEGKGAEVKSGQTIRVSYTGSLWKDNSVFDSSLGKDPGYAEFPIGTGGVIPGWDKGLVGQKVGSRILLVIPPADGYGTAGSPPAISGTDTLVFVVDILSAS